MVIKQIIEDNGISGTQLVSFGDVYVGIQLVADSGGYTVGVATDEARKKGVNLQKRQRLLDAGADVIIPDFTDAEKLASFLFSKGR